MNLFLVSAPPHIINALEAKWYFGLPTAATALVVFHPVGPHGDFSPMLDPHDWGAVYHLKLLNWHHSPIQYLLGSKEFLRLLDDLASRFRHVEYLFVSLYESDFMRHLVNSIRFERLVLLDDGNSVLKISRVRTALCGGTPGRISPRTQVADFVKSVVIGYKLDHAPRLTYYTAYEFPVPSGDEVHINRYPRLRAEMNYVKDSEDTLFLGVPFVSDGLMDQAMYLQYLSRAFASLQHNDIVYAPHRRESSESVAAIMDKLSCRSLYPTVPIESYLVRSPIRYLEIASFTSGALLNLLRIFDASVRLISFEVDVNDILVRREWLPIREVYEYYKSLGCPSFEVRVL